LPAVSIEEMEKAAIVAIREKLTHSWREVTIWVPPQSVCQTVLHFLLFGENKFVAPNTEARASTNAARMCREGYILFLLRLQQG
jgi:hypothetical protein